MAEDSEKPEPGAGAQRRIFPPLYKSSGNLASDRLAFFHIIERLKVCFVLAGLALAYGIVCRVSPDTKANGMGR